MSENTESLGCGDSGCVIEKPRGMATNGGCHCLDGVPPDVRVKLRRAFAALRQRASLPTTPEEWRAWWGGLDEERRHEVEVAVRALAGVFLRGVRPAFGERLRAEHLAAYEERVAAEIAELGRCLVGGVPR